MWRRFSLFGYPYDDITLKEVIDYVVRAIKNNEKHYFVVQNTNKMYLSSKNVILREMINNSSLILPENSFYIGNLLMGKRLRQYNLTTDLIKNLLDISNINKYSIYFLGATDDILTKLIINIYKEYPNIKIIGYHNGYFNENEETEIAYNIGKLMPNILIIGMGSPRQELFIYKHFLTLNTNITVGMGGALKLLAEIEKPAPNWTKYGFEWLYRSFQDPKKFKRYLIINTYFIKELIFKGLLKI